MYDLVKKAIFITLIIFIPMLLTNIVLSQLHEAHNELKQVLIFIGLFLGVIIYFLFIRVNLKKH